MAEMIWCQSCKKVVWAYDHQPKKDIRGLFNLMKMPCPLCGDEGNFDGWGHSNPAELNFEFPSIYDDWSAMKYVANYNGVKWCPSLDNRWFPEEKERRLE